MHEFFHRYARYVSSDIYLQLDQNFVDATLTRFRKARHMSLLCESITQPLLKDMENCKALRTLISLPQHKNIGKLSYKLILSLQSLRVLDLSDTDICNLPESLGELKHLSLLNVSKSKIQDLPASTTDLHKLDFLKLKGCHQLFRLPNNTKNLTTLQHLEVDVNTLSSMPPMIGNLKNLKRLPVFIVGYEHGYLITELKELEHLKGSICLKNLENVNDCEEAREARLTNKSSLRRLELEWSDSSTYQSVAVDEVFQDVLIGLKPHENLAELRVMRYYGVEFPSWLSSPECQLESIHLQECHGCRSLPPLGQLSNLRDLHLEGMHHVEYVDSRFSIGGTDVAGFSSLVSLIFQDMENLKQWEELQDTQMPRLCQFKLVNCPNLIGLPSLHQLTSLQILEIHGCTRLQSLPQEGLPSSLVTLIIAESPLLRQSCKPHCGADWDKIKAIPNVLFYPGF